MNFNYHSGPNEIPHLPKSVIHLGWGIQQKQGRRRNAVIDETFLLDDQLHLSLEVGHHERARMQLDCQNHVKNDLLDSMYPVVQSTDQ